MKKLLLLLFAVTLGFTAVSCKGWKDKEANFRKTTWGMSREQVKASEDSAPTGDKSEVITYRGEVEGIPVIVGYLFDGDKLVRAGYLMQGSYEDPNSYISDYNKVKDFLINEHGTPAQDEVVWKEGEEVDDPGKFGESVCSGKLRYTAIWADRETVIKENLYGENGKCNHGVMFESVELSISKKPGNKEAQPPTPGP